MNIYTLLSELSEMFCVCGKFDYGVGSLNGGWEVNGSFMHTHLQSQGTCVLAEQKSNRAAQQCSG